MCMKMLVCYRYIEDVHEDAGMLDILKMCMKMLVCYRYIEDVHEDAGMLQIY